VNVHFAASAWDDFGAWHAEDAAIVRKLLELIHDIRRTPFKGLGKPEPLKGPFAGYWSRRIDREHRLIYAVAGRQGDDRRVLIAACRGHYD
jgi:toxin YoeB